MRRVLGFAVFSLITFGASPDGHAQVRIFRDQAPQNPQTSSPTYLERGYNFFMKKSSELAGGAYDNQGKLSKKGKFIVDEEGNTQFSGPGVLVPPPSAPAYSGPVYAPAPVYSPAPVAPAQPAAPIVAGPSIQYGPATVATPAPQIQAPISIGTPSVNAMPSPGPGVVTDFAIPATTPTPQDVAASIPSPNRNYDETRKAMRRDLTEYEKSIIYNEKKVY